APRSIWAAHSQLPEETQAYVPAVLAWEFIIRYVDENGIPPPLNGNNHVAIASRSTGNGEAQRGYAPYVVSVTLDEQSEESPPTSGVWYTAQSGDTLGAIAVMLGAPIVAIRSLNPGLPTGALSFGARVLLPEERFAFHEMNDRETYSGVAARHQMSVAEMSRWSGRWSDRDVAEAIRRDCPPDGCTDEYESTRAGERLLVRR
ncbi:MAG: LysM domain-containing protein, partial [Candidatus Uhrbacteria bacterium]